MKRPICLELVFYYGKKRGDELMAKVGKLLWLVIKNIPMLIVLVGLGLISYGAFKIYVPVGFIIMGIALVLAGWFISPDEEGGE